MRSTARREIARGAVGDPEALAEHVRFHPPVEVGDRGRTVDDRPGDGEARAVDRPRGERQKIAQHGVEGRIETAFIPALEHDRRMGSTRVDQSQKRLGSPDVTSQNPHRLRRLARVTRRRSNAGPIVSLELPPCGASSSRGLKGHVYMIKI